MIRRLQNAFTLIEVLVAVAIFSLVAALAYGTLNQTVLSAELLSDRMNRLQALQRAVQVLTDDFRQLAPRPVRDELGDNFVPVLSTGFQSGFTIEMTRGGWSNPMILPRSTLQRTAYAIEDNELVRYYWNVLDRTLSNEAIETALLDDVESLQFRFFQENGEYIDQWPPLSGGDRLNNRRRPIAVEFTLTTGPEGAITRLVEIAP